jgi:excinuclease UvrABC nuclease subunit
MPSLRAFGAHSIQNPFEGRQDTRKRRRFKAQTRELPKCPGVYFFHGHNDRLLYIGKAKVLRERVRSYFSDTSLPRPHKIKRLLAEIERYEVRPVGSELEALLLERRLIAEMQPLLNRQHKRFEVYPYLLLSNEEFPRLTITRAEPAEGEKDDETGQILREMRDLMGREPQNGLRPLETPPRAGEIPGTYLGPFTSPRHAYWALEAVVKLFPLRSCEGELVVQTEGRGCFYREIGRCCGPCVGQTPREEYAKLCADLVQLLQTGEASQIDALKLKMTRLADEWKFEEAAVVKEQLGAIEAVAARLRRLERMRRENNAVIAQPGLPTENGAPQTALFLVRGGAVRRHLLVENDEKSWQRAAKVIREIFEGEMTAAQFTAKTELDEMMILDRWLRSNGDQPCVAWMNQKSSRQWGSNAMRQLKSAASGFQSAAPKVEKAAPKLESENMCKDDADAS